MATKKTIPRTKWSKEQLEKYIRKESLVTPNVIFTEHVLVQMKKRKILQAWVFETLRKGRIKLHPEFDSFKGDVKCRMEYFVAGTDVRVVVAISDDDPNLVLVTAI
ncbi:DUF4258 domain-containing protein [Undibacterium sp. Tian12W]|uniref:DUF4258 domain-containing protein n=1 Tax=Undibacterium sp. Tian12W TaxID=3413054 RepID=UPI003BF1794F